MLVSEHFNLGRKQPTLDFVDVDVVGDVPVFVSPRAIRLLPSEWGDECVSLVRDFFRTVLRNIREGQNEVAESLLRTLREPNETHLGLSRGRAQGRALGSGSAHEVWSALSNSEAARSGLLEDLEDTILMVEGISIDIVSDMTTNIIRGPLVKYTQEVCGYYGIPMQPQVDSGPMWDAQNTEWFQAYVELPVAPSGKLLLVPKAIVRKHLDYDAGEYYRHYLLEQLREAEFNSNSELVELLKNGRRRVTKKRLIQKYGQGKNVIVRETLNHPDALEQYRRAKQENIAPPLLHGDFAELEGSDAPNWDELLNEVTRIPPGTADASAYESAVEALLTALFYPYLTNPNPQHKIHQGRKRIDITYTNMASSGFFGWLARNYPAPHVFVECKNYSREVANEELDQLSGRFSPSRGKFGMLVCRQFTNKNRFIQRCRDTALDNRGYIVALDDGDLADLVEERKNSQRFGELPLLRRAFESIIN